VDETCKVTLELTNTGHRVGSEVVQVYIAPPATAIERPVKELKGFRKVYLEAGEKKQVEIEMDTVMSTSYWHEGRDKWCSEAGKYKVLVGPSSVDTPLEATFVVDKTKYWTGLSP
jgi:beta-glucosidase